MSLYAIIQWFILQFALLSSPVVLGFLLVSGWLLLYKFETKRQNERKTGRNGKSEFLKSKPRPVSSGIKYDYDVEAAVYYRISNAESTDSSQFTSDSNNQNNCGENYPDGMNNYSDFTADDV
ncbi:UDP-3-O-acyl-N-acetylglucosamine deacetylase [Trichinella spiralis]|uniref:UDP-3-O-acyl-N-acetylglucosamine deacetylase n=1 Tax=Trichinella spiralis TaxID=6334 RepID=A0ABR3L0B1_TRISP